MPLSKNLRLALAVFYVVFISVLFVLPGSAFPKDDWLAKVWFDKWVHIGLFTGLGLAWSWALDIDQPKYLRVLFFLFAFYGIGVEIVQDLLVANRSFDIGDWIADMVGSLLGLWFWWQRYIKK
ncbi:MAG TPA: VanZ family protein [Chitinophagaceae bacterium]